MHHKLTGSSLSLPDPCGRRKVSKREKHKIRARSGSLRLVSFGKRPSHNSVVKFSQLQTTSPCREHASALNWMMSDDVEDEKERNRQEHMRLTFCDRPDSRAFFQPESHDSNSRTFESRSSLMNSSALQHSANLSAKYLLHRASLILNVFVGARSSLPTLSEKTRSIGTFSEDSREPRLLGRSVYWDEVCMIFAYTLHLFPWYV